MAKAKKLENRVHKMNPNRPLAGNQYEYTQAQFEEFVKCNNDILYFAENYFYIVTGKGRGKITLFNKQKEILTALVKNKFTAIVSSRQNSKTTLMTIYCLYRAIFNGDKLLAYAANKESTAKEILNRIKLAYEELPPWLKPGIKTWNEKSVEFENSSKILIGTTAADSFRGLTIDTLFLDEFAFVPAEIANEFLNSVMPAISSIPESKVIMVSTPNGAQGLFYEYYNKGILNYDNNPRKWNSIKMHWTDFPGRNQQYLDDVMTSLNGDSSRFAQEYDCQFLDTGVSAFNGKLISELKDTLKKVQPVERKYNGAFKVYKHFNSSRKYVVGIDVSGGVGADSHCMQILDVTDLTHIEQVAVYVNNFYPVNVFAHHAYEILQSWNSPIAVIENNNQGSGFISFLKYIFKYENIVNYKKKARLEPAEFDLMDGVESNSHVKIAGIDNFKYFFEHKESLFLNEIETVLELESFTKKENGGFGAKKRTNDDRVMALVWALFIFEKEIAEKYLKVVSWDVNGKPSQIVPDHFDKSFQNHMILHDYKAYPIFINGESITQNSYREFSFV